MKNRFIINIVTQMAIKVHKSLPPNMRDNIPRDRLINDYLQDKQFIPVFISLYIMHILVAVMLSVIAFLVCGCIFKSKSIENVTFLVITAACGLIAGASITPLYISSHVKGIINNYDLCVKYYNSDKWKNEEVLKGGHYEEEA